jgi:hypothetical protein
VRAYDRLREASKEFSKEVVVSFDGLKIKF